LNSHYSKFHESPLTLYEPWLTSHRPLFQRGELFLPLEKGGQEGFYKQTLPFFQENLRTSPNERGGQDDVALFTHFLITLLGRRQGAEPRPGEPHKKDRGRDLLLRVGRRPLLLKNSICRTKAYRQITQESYKKIRFALIYLLYSSLL
jgi:hypothetical protein